LAIEETSYLTVEEAITLHILLMREWNEVRFGVDRRDLRESALNRPKQAANFEDAGLIEQAATLCFGLIKNHPWLGGNKRTATYLTEVFFEMNGSVVNASDTNIVALALNVESGKFRVPEITAWFNQNTRKIRKKK
jgi:death on curing protein